MENSINIILSVYKIQPNPIIYRCRWFLNDSKRTFNDRLKSVLLSVYVANIAGVNSHLSLLLVLVIMIMMMMMMMMMTIKFK